MDRLLGPVISTKINHRAWSIVAMRGIHEPTLLLYLARHTDSSFVSLSLHKHSTVSTIKSTPLDRQRLPANIFCSHLRIAMHSTIIFSPLVGLAAAAPRSAEPDVEINGQGKSDDSVWASWKRLQPRCHCSYRGFFQLGASGLP